MVIIEIWEAGDSSWHKASLRISDQNDCRLDIDGDGESPLQAVEDMLEGACVYYDGPIYVNFPYEMVGPDSKQTIVNYIKHRLRLEKC